MEKDTYISPKTKVFSREIQISISDQITSPRHIEKFKNYKFSFLIMDKEFREWRNSSALSFSISPWIKCIEKLLKNNFDPYQKAVILSDYGYPTSKTAPRMSELYARALNNLNISTNQVFQEPKSSGEGAEPQIIQAILESDTDTLVLLCFSGKMGSLGSVGKSFRKYARKNNISFLSSSGLSDIKNSQFDDFMESIDVDYEEMSSRAKKIKELLDNGKKIRIKTEKGTNLEIDISEFKAVRNDGMYHGKKGGNIPVGEVYIAPRKRTGKGKLVIDVSSRNRYGTTIIKKPITITFKEGEAVVIEGDKEAKDLQDSLEWVKDKAKYPWGIKLIGEIGIGINPKAKILGPTLVNEKKAGTAHIALGSNSWFGGDIFALNHYDQVFNNPKIEIDDNPIDLKNILDY